MTVAEPPSEAPAAPLTTLSEDEKLFAEAVREFALGEIAPHVLEMDEAQKINPEIIAQCFELGLMAIEIPEEHGGLVAAFFDGGATARHSGEHGDWCLPTKRLVDRGRNPTRIVA